MPGIYSAHDAIIGVQGALGGRGGGLRYLLRDDFVTDRAAGAVEGTLAEPGPGTRVVNDVENKITISGGELYYTTPATPNWSGDEYLRYGAIVREAGRIMLAKWFRPTHSDQRLGFSNSTVPHGAGPGTFEAYLYGPVLASTTNYEATILRAAGYFSFSKSGSNWLLYWINSTGNTATLYPAFTYYNTIGNGHIDYIRVPVAKWLPTPLLSDGFGSAFGTSDGLGHAEGVAGGIGAGGSGVALSNAGGTWSISGGKAINTAPSGLVQELGIANLSCSDVYAGVSVVRALGNEVGLGLCWDSDSSPANGLKIHSDGAGNIKVDKYVAGVKTNVSTTAFTYSAGARLVSTMNAGALRTYYNGALVKADTIVDASILTGTHHGGYSNGGVSTLDDLTVYATGTGGEYSQLDSY